MADINALANTAAERMRASSDKSDAKFYDITMQVVRGSGISSPYDLRKVTGQVRAELRRRSANHRKSEAVRKKERAAS